MKAHLGSALRQCQQCLVQCIACDRVRHPLRFAIGLYRDIMVPGMERPCPHRDRHFPYGCAGPEPVEHTHAARIQRKVDGAAAGGLLERYAFVIQIDVKTTAGQYLGRQAPDWSGSHNSGPLLVWVSHGTSCYQTSRTGKETILRKNVFRMYVGSPMSCMVGNRRMSVPTAASAMFFASHVPRQTCSPSPYRRLRLWSRRMSNLSASGKT